MTIFLSNEKKIFDILCGDSNFHSLKENYLEKVSRFNLIRRQEHLFYTDKPETSVFAISRVMDLLKEMDAFVSKQKIVVESILTLFNYLKRLTNVYKKDRKKFIEIFEYSTKLDDIIKKQNEAISYVRLLHIQLIKQKSAIKTSIDSLVELKTIIDEKKHEEAEKVWIKIQSSLNELSTVLSLDVPTTGEGAIYNAIIADAEKSDSHVKEIARAILEFKEIKVQYLKEQSAYAGQLFGCLLGFGLASFIIFKMVMNPSSDADVRLLENLQSTTSVGEQVAYRLANQYSGIQEGLTLILGTLIGTSIGVSSLFSFLRKKSAKSIYG